MNTTTTNLGRVGGRLAECLAYLNSPSRIDAEIRRHAAAIAAGDTSPETAAQLGDWRAVREAQRRLVGGGDKAIVTAAHEPESQTQQRNPP